MSTKKIGIIVVSIIAIGIASVGYLYFTFRQEPKARYAETDNPKLTRIREQLAELKADLRKKGLYDCCIRNDCNWCAIYMGHCPCEKLVSEKGNEKSCPECAAAWNRKQGRIPGVDPDAIQVTTFGVYGYEKGGHHGDAAERETDEKNNEEKENHH